MNEVKAFSSGRNRCFRESFWHQQNTCQKRSFYRVNMVNQILGKGIKFKDNAISTSKVMTFYNV